MLITSIACIKDPRVYSSLFFQIFTKSESVSSPGLPQTANFVLLPYRLISGARPCTGLSQHTVQGNFELYSISLNFIYKIMVQMSFYCVYILPQSYARVQFPKFLRFLWEIKAASAKKVRKTGQPFSQQPVHQHFLVLKEHQNV